MISFDEDIEHKKVSELHEQEEEDLAQRLSAQFNVSYINFNSTPVNSDALRLIEETTARSAKLAPYNIVDKKAYIAVLSPQNEQTKKVIESIQNRGYEPIIGTASINSLERAWKFYKDLSFATETKAGSLEISNEEISNLVKLVRTIEDIKKFINDTLAQNKGYKISKIFEILIAGALATGASDIHIEPEENYVRIRYRLDGVLNNLLSLDRDTFSLLIARIKLLSGMKLNIKGEAQDGRLSVKINDQEIEIRSSVLPGAYGEAVVLRVLNPETIAVNLEALGMDERLLALVTKEIAKPNGLILNTGPTGSGKTTTLYAFLKKVHTTDIKIITIEDPIEYHLPGIVQTQTDTEKGYTFLQGLRSALRQDPDIIMVGEIRDRETAEIAVNSALTGHLVFSTLHTNNAAGTFPRLIDLGVNPKIISSAISVAMAQRLVRKLCSFCKKEVPLDSKNKKLAEEIVKSISNKSYVVPVATHYQAVGCEKCNNTGYKGRIGIFEAILMDEMVEKIVINNPSEREIKKAALSQGILDMRQDGILKVLKGITSLDELSRVIDLEAEIQPELEHKN